MIFIDNEGVTDPTLNLAIEEYILTRLPVADDYLLFYMNEPSIIIGRNQNTIEEINTAYVEKHGLHVVRRLSGGGAVYHDLGNLNFSFITKEDGHSFHNFKRFTDPVVSALRGLGVAAELSGRNDIQVGSRKISGNAQFAAKGRMFSHGTLMFDSRLEDVVSALKVNPAKIESKGIKSIRSRVANISEFLMQPMNIREFRDYLLSSLAGGHAPAYRLTEEDWASIREIRVRRYANWQWNYGESPPCNRIASRRFEGIGTVEVRLNIVKGVIRQARIYGDFFGTGDVRELEQALIGAPYSKPMLTPHLEAIDFKRFFGGLDPDRFMLLLID